MGLIPTNEDIEKLKKEKEEENEKRKHDISEALRDREREAWSNELDKINEYLKKQKQEAYEREMKEAEIEKGKAGIKEVKDKYGKDPVSEDFRKMAKNIDRLINHDE